MKKIRTMIPVLLLALSLAACGTHDGRDSITSQSDDAPSVETVEDIMTDTEKTEETEYAAETETAVLTEAPTAPIAPTISLISENGGVILEIEAVDHADMYEIYINGVCVIETSDLLYSIEANRVNVGANEIYVRALNEVGYSENSSVVTTGKLADPQYHATGTGVEFPWGDVENADGYMIYGDDGAYLTTIPLGGTYDFADLYTEEGFYIPHIQAYADGWISSEKCGIPVIIGSHGGPTGPNE